jgi:N-acylneuraminate cytidylyltransferase/3-deoxy-D-manno-octulosonate 8-phosphate phosphatase (KDO 8-P phosphatase)
MNIRDIDVFVFDFDGVLTSNFVYINEDGMESVACNRADGLAFDVLRKLQKPAFILSTEKNSVVSSRAKKLKIKAIQGSSDKLKSLKRLIKEKKYNKSKVLFVGNDINDYQVMKFCGYSACPLDAHSKIKNISDIVINVNGGSGVVRELLENVLNLDFINILYCSPPKN